MTTSGPRVIGMLGGMSWESTVEYYRLANELVRDRLGGLPSARIEEAATRHDVLIANIAHAGDGNLHPLLVTPPGDDAARVRAQAAFAEIIEAALAAGGTVTGEHGVGLHKRVGLLAELDPVVVAMHQALRRALDPAGILNPGKVVAQVPAGPDQSGTS